MARRVDLRLLHRPFAPPFEPSLGLEHFLARLRQAGLVRDELRDHITRSLLDHVDEADLACLFGRSTRGNAEDRSYTSQGLAKAVLSALLELADEPLALLDQPTNVV